MTKINKVITFLFLIMLMVFATACTKKYELTLEEADKSITLTVGDEKTIVPSFTEGATLEWSSDATTVVSVNNGVLKALTPGTATVTVKVSEAEVSASISVTVVAPLPSSVKISGDNSMKIGGNVQLSATIAPEYATGTIEWTSSDTAIATVDNNGKVTSIKDGKVTITAKVVNSGLTAEVKDTIEITISLYDPTAVEISGGVDSLEIGSTVQLSATITPANAVQTMTWTSSDSAIATVDQTGKVTALKTGTVDITVTSSVATVKDVQSINVIAPAAKSVAITGSEDLIVGEVAEYTAKVAPALASQEVVWSIDNSTIATVSETGVVTAKAVGTVVLTATAKDTEIKIEKTITVSTAPATTGLVVSASLAEKVNGTSVIYDGNKYLLGTNAFSTLADVSAKLADGSVVYVLSGDYTEMTISVSNVTLKGVDNPVISGIITIESTAKNTSFEKLSFTGAGQIRGVEAGTEGLKVEYCTFDASSVTAAEGSVCCMGPAKDIVFNNNNVINNKAARTVRIKTTCVNLEVNNNLFQNASGSYDYIRCDAALSGIVNICDNEFNGSSQSAIMVMAHGSGTFKVMGNEFYNITATAVDIRTTKGVVCNSTIDIMYNLFDNTDCSVDDIWGVIRLRFNNYTAETLRVNVNYNAFINWGTYYIDDATEKVGDAYPDKLVICNFDSNYYETSDELTTDSFSGVASSWANRITEYKEFERQVSLYKLNSTGDEVKLVGTSTTITKQKYATLADALAAAQPGDTIYLLPGTYAENVTISVNNIAIKTLNADVNPNSTAARADEAIYTGTITLAKGLVGFELNGIKFTGAAQIITTKGDAGSSSDLKTNLDGFTFVNNIVESAATTGKGFIYFVAEGGSCYNHNIVIKNNSFTSATGAATDAMIWLDNTYDVEFVANVFENVNADALYVNDTTKGLSGQTNVFVSNTFKNVTGEGIHINWLSPLPASTDTATVDICHNTFDNVTAEAIYIGQMNNSDKYARIDVSYNTFTSVGTGVTFVRVQAIDNVTANYNLFTNIPTEFYFVNKQTSTSAPCDIDATENLFMNESAVITPAADKFSNLAADKSVVKYETTITSLDDLPQFVEYAEMILIDVQDLSVGDKYLLGVLFDPEVPFYQDIIWSSSDESILKIEDGYAVALQSGTVTITAVYAANPEVNATEEVKVTEDSVVEIRFEGNGILEAAETVELSATVANQTADTKYNYTSSNTSVATVDSNGVVTAVAAGNVTITVALDGTESKSTVALTVIGADMTNELLKLLVEANNGVIMYQKINYIGYEAGCESVPHMVYGSANKYYAIANPTIIENMVPETNGNVDFNDKISKVELITVHDTGAASSTSTAQANSKWCTNTTNTGTSWHYTIGNDGIYQQLEDDVIGWHAGDGSTNLTGTIDTGVKATEAGVRAKVTIDNGYYVVNGTKTTLLAPTDADGNTLTTADIVDSGIVTIIGANGNYFINTYYNKTYKKIASYGGASSIGIETAVNTGSDVYLTWQRTAKFVASKLIQYNLTLDRVVQHNNLSGKNCPQTMRTAGLWSEFMKMVEIEYLIQKNYSDYAISFTSSNPEVLDNTGRVVGEGPKYTTAVDYTITVTKGTETYSATTSVLVIGYRNAE